MAGSIFDVKDFGAQGDGVTYDDDAFDRALAAINGLSNVADSRGAVLHIPHGVYKLARSIRVVRNLIIQGVGGTGNGNTMLVFDPDVDGIVVHGANTSGGLSPTGWIGGQGTGAWTTIRDLAVQSNNAFGSGNSPRPPINEDQPLSADPVRSGNPHLTGNGIVLFNRARIVNCLVVGFHYDGIHIESTDPVKNANTWEVHNCVLVTNGRHGLYVAGGNSQGGCAFSTQMLGNSGWAVYERSFLGNTYVGCLAEANGHFATDIRSIVPHPTDPSVVCAGTWDGGVFRSTDRGNNWIACNKGLARGDAQARNQVAAAMVAVTMGTGHPLQLPGASSTLYYAGIDDGVLYSVEYPFDNDFNGGLSVWRRPGDLDATGPASPLTRQVCALAVSPASVLVLYAGTQTAGVYKSVDAGKNWAPVTTGITDLNVRALVASPGPPETLYAGTDGGGMFKSTDGGASWTAANTGIPAAAMRIQTLAVPATAPATIYAGTRGGGLFKSIDSGATWTAVNTGLADNDIRSIAIHPTVADTLYAGTMREGVFKSTNGGASWSAARGGLPSPFKPVQALALHASSPNTLYAGLAGGGVVAAANPGGVFRTDDAATTWVAKPDTWYGGAYRALGGNATNVFVGCYEESGQGSGSVLYYPSLVFGGKLSEALSAYTSAGAIDGATIRRLRFRGLMNHNFRFVGPFAGPSVPGATTDDEYVLVDASGGNIVLVLPNVPAGTDGQIIVVKKVDTVAGNTVDIRIGGDASWQYVLSVPGEAVTLLGTRKENAHPDYKVVAHYLPTTANPEPVATAP